MSAAGTQVRQSAASAARAHAPQQASRVAARQAPVHAYVSSEEEDEFKVNLNDIPRQGQSLEVDGLKPSLLSRLFEMLAPISK
jgi:hypothetical protein